MYSVRINNSFEVNLIVSFAFFSFFFFFTYAMNYWHYYRRKTLEVKKKKKHNIHRTYHRTFRRHNILVILRVFRSKFKGDLRSNCCNWHCAHRYNWGRTTGWHLFPVGILYQNRYCNNLHIPTYFTSTYTLIHSVRSGNIPSCK